MRSGCLLASVVLCSVATPGLAQDAVGEPRLRLPLEWREARSFDLLGGRRFWRVRSDRWLTIHVPSATAVVIGDTPGDRWLGQVTDDRASGLEVAYSNGSGLLIEADLRAVPRGFEVQLPDPRQPWLLHVRRLGTGPSAVRIWLGEAEELTPPMRVRALRSDPGDAVRIRDSASGRSERYRHVEAGETLAFPAGTTALQVRLPFDRSPRTLVSAYLTRGHELRFTEIAARVERGRRLVDGLGKSRLLSARRYVPLTSETAGELSFSRDVWLQPIEAASRQWLLRGVNTRGLEPGQSPPDAATIIRAARDNLRRAAPLAVLDAAARRPDALTSTLSAALEQVRSSGLDFRSLRPEGTSGADFAIWDDPPVGLLGEPEREAPGIETVGDHQLARARRNEAPLHALKLGVRETGLWRLPELASATELRLFASGEGRLEVSVDDHGPLHLWLARDEARADLLRAPLTARQRPALASASLRIPAGAKRLAIEVIDGEATVGAKLALPRNWRGDEDFWRAARRATSAEMRQRWLRDALASGGRAPACRDDGGPASCGYGPGEDWAAAIRNAWLPVLQEVRARARAFADGRHLAIAGYFCRSDPSVLAEADDWVRIARLTWLLHREARTRPSSEESAQPGACVDAYMALADSLFEVGEPVFAVDYLRTLMLDSGKPDLAWAAEDRLRAHYRDHRAHDARLTLESHAFLAHPDETALAQLIEALVAAGHDRGAIELALSSPAPPVAALWPALVRLDWLALARELGAGPARLADPLATLSAEEASVWRPAPVARAAGARWLYDPSEDASRPRWLATADSPLELDVSGPAVLRVSARELRPPEAWEDPANRWLEVEDGSRRLPLRLTGGRPSARFEVREPGLLAGPRNEWLVTLPAGAHHLVLRVTEPALIDVERQYRLGYPMNAADLPQRLPGTWGAAREVIEQPRGFAPIVAEAVGPTGDSLPWLADTRRWLAAPWDGDCLGIDAERAARHVGNLRFDVARGKPLIPALVRAERLARCFPGDPVISAELASLRVESEWREADDVVAGAGIRAERHPAQRFLHEFMRARALALPQPVPGERLVPTNREMTWTLFNPAPVRVRITARVVTVDASPTSHRGVMVSEGGRTRALTVDAEGNAHAELELQAGTAVIRLRASTPARGHYLLAALSRWEQGRWQSAGSDVTETVHLALPGHPVRVNVSGPAWLRADRHGADGTVRYRYMAVPSGSHALTFDEPGGWRFWVRSPREALPPKRRYVRPALPVLAWPALDAERVPIELDASGDTASEGITNVRPLFTWSSGVALRRARAPDESGRLSDDDFLQLASAWRRKEGDLGVRTETGLRLRTSGDPTFFVAHRRQRRLAHWPLTLTGTGRLFTQGAGETTLFGSAALRYSRRYGERLLTNSTVRAFGRVLGVSPDGREHDQDVFTRYKFDHRNGVTLSQQVAFTPWLDSELRATLQLTTNEWHHPDLERLSAQLGWRQMLGPVQLELRYAERHFLPDRDRRKARSSGRLNLELRAHHWSWLGRRWQLTARVGHDVRTGRVVGSIGIERHRGGGQALADFTADELWHDEVLRWRAFSAAQGKARDD